MSKSRRPLQQEWSLLEVHHRGPERPAADPLAARSSFNLGLGIGPELVWGRVVDYVAGIHTYKVQVERGMPTITCGYSAPGGNGPLGAKGVGTLVPGTQVIVLWHRGTNYGLIIATEPYFGSDPTKGLSDFWFLGSRVGLSRDLAHSVPFLMNTRGLVDFSAGRPFDSLGGGEWGAICETGARVLLDAHQVQLGFGEACGVHAFLVDRLCRVSGVNLEVRSLGAERDVLADEGELFDVDRRFVYPWESLGAGRQGQTLHREFDAETSQLKTPHYGPVEPMHDDQIGIPRAIHVSGYLGQGGKRIVQAPTSAKIGRLSDPADLVTLFEEGISLTGAYLLKSAKEILITKTPNMIRIRQRKLPADPEGDGEDYKRSGAFGDGPSHTIKGAPADPSGRSPHVAKIAAAKDAHAHLFWDFAHPFHYHGKDWDTSDAGQGFGASGAVIRPIPFDQLAGNAETYLPPPATQSINIDHRYGSVQYALAESVFSLRDDGTVVIGSGYGPTLTLGPEGAVLSGHDVKIRAGRNLDAWAGDNVSIRAKENLDISTTRGSMRLKSEEHLWMLAGNGGADGLLLLESRGAQRDYVFNDGQPRLGNDAMAAGIAMRSTNAPLVGCGADVYFRTGGGSVGQGVVVLDGGKGTTGVITNSGGRIDFMPMSGGRYDAFLSGTTVQSVHAFGADAALVNGQLYVVGDTAVIGQLLVDNWIYSNKGHIATGVGNRYVFSIESGSLDGFFGEIRQVGRTIQSSLSNYYNQAIEERFYAEFKPGNEQVMQFAEFSFRTAEQYGTLGVYHIFEDPWQQMARQSGDGEIWVERSVTAQGQPTAPFPGYEVLVAGNSYYEMDLTMVDTENGRPQPRGTAEETADCYASPQYATPTAKSLNSGYRVIKPATNEGRIL